MADISKIKLPDGNTYDVKDTSKSSATNWVNGSQDSSVRTVGSATEDSSYTMGTYAIAEGYDTKASGDYGSHAEGASTVASANGAHAEGLSTTSSNYGSHAEGVSTTASGLYSHAEGRQAIASGESSHAEGTETLASGQHSHASGIATIAQGYGQTVIGRCNIAQGSTNSQANGDYVFIIGNGTTTTSRHNALAIDWSGNMTLQGKITIGTAGTNSMDVATVGQIPSNWVNGSQDGSVRTVTSAAEDSSYTIGSYAVTEGYNTKANGYSAHAEGYNSVASGDFSHVEGYSTTASNGKDHAEGYQTTASGGCAHAEGYGTTASGLDSHAEGDSTIANHLAQHVFGQYNIADTSTATAADRGKYIEIVGNGSYNARSNARTLDWSGNEVLTGKLTVGAVGVNSMDVATIGQLPTKTSDLTNDSGFITTDNDEKLRVWDIAGQSSTLGYIIIGNGTSAQIRSYDSLNFYYNLTKGTTSSGGTAELILGNGLDDTTDKNTRGQIRLYGVGNNSTLLRTSVLRNNNIIDLPNASGTIALTSDIPDVSGFITTETDPVFSASAAADITDTDINSWKNANSLQWNNSSKELRVSKNNSMTTVFSKSDLDIPTKTSDLTNDSGFITSETDPVFSASAAAGITATDISNWNNKSDFSGDYIDLINKPTIPTKNIWYATCNTAANVEAKIATTTSGDFTLSDGNMVRILMTNGNTSVSAPTISIDGTTAKIIYYIKGSYSNHKWVAGEVIDLVYDEASSRLIMLEGGVASTTDYGVTRLIDSVSSTSTVTAATPNAVKQAYDNGGVQSVNGNTGAVILSIPTNTSDLTNDSGFITGYTETDPVFTASAAHGISTTDITNWNSKQAALVSGTNIKTINGTSLLGSGNITIADIGIHISTSAPTSSDGNNGDIWLVYTDNEE